jgi:hypothetical protein
MPAIDTFHQYDTSLISPLTHGFAITPSDSEELSEVTRELYVGGAGNIVLVLKSGDEITLNAVPAGLRLPYRVRQVRATDTTATHLVGLY